MDAPLLSSLPAPGMAPEWTAQFATWRLHSDPAIQALEAIFDERLKTAAPGLWAWTPDIKLKTEHSDIILSKLEAGLPRQHVKIMEVVFRAGLTHKNNVHGERIALPPLRRQTANYANLLTPIHFVLSHVLDEIEEALNRRLPEVFAAPASVLSGAVLFYAAVSDSLCYGPRLKRLSLIEHVDLDSFSSFCLTNLDPFGAWLLQPTTQTLLFAFDKRFGLPLCNATEPSSGKAKSVPDALQALGEFLNLSDDAQKALRDRVGKLTLARHMECLEGYLVGYAHGISSSSSFSMSALCHLLDGRPVSTVHDSSKLKSKRAPGMSSRLDTAYRENPMCAVRGVIDKLNCKSISVVKAIAELDVLAADPTLWSIQRALMTWVSKQIRSISKHGGRWSSLRRNYMAIWKPLLWGGLDGNLALIDLRQAERWVDTAMHLNSSNKARLTFQETVPDFLSFLNSEVQFPVIDLRGLDNYITEKQSNVNVGWLTEHQFDQLTAVLSKNEKRRPDWMVEYAQRMARLAYRGGLRRSEIGQISLRDILPSKTPEIVVRENAWGTLKSAQAERRIPIHGLFPANEADDLLAFVARRREAAGLDEPLFINPKEPQHAMKTDSVMCMVTDALSIVTGDPDAVFHLLRHSRANSLLFQLAIADQRFSVPAKIHVFSHDNFSMKRCVQVRNAIFICFENVPLDSGYRNLFAICVFMGHLSPVTTLKNYIHALPLMIFLCSNGIQKPVTEPECLAAAMGISRSYWFEIRGELGLPDLPKSLADLAPIFQEQYRQRHRQPPAGNTPSSAAS
jgi:integrase